MLFPGGISTLRGRSWGKRGDGIFVLEKRGGDHCFDGDRGSCFEQSRFHFRMDIFYLFLTVGVFSVVVFSCVL